jgi:RNA polymerase sigma-70 factor (ECF subfamily)
MRKVAEKESTVEFEKKVVAMINSGSTAEREVGFALLFKKYKPMIFNFLNRALYSDEETAKDLMMAVFTKIHLKLDSYSPEKSALSTWIYKITKNTFLDHLRSIENKDTLSLDYLNESANNSDGEKVSQFQVLDNSISNDLLGLMVRDERAKALVNALNSIKNVQQRRVLIARYLEQKSYVEIVEEMNIPLNTVKVLVFRAKISLKLILQKQGFKN